MLLKLSGEWLGGETGGIDFAVAGGLCDDLAEVHKLGVRIGLVIGGGNILRAADTADSGLDRPSRDAMGMLATVINALAVAGLLEGRGVPARVLTATDMRPFAEPFSMAGARDHLEQGRVVLFAGGTGHPYFTTDTAAALRAVEMQAEVLMKATNVDGVFDADPRKVPGAKRYTELDYATALSKQLGVMDAAAISLCRENRLPILVFNLSRRGSIMEAVRGGSTGTIVRGS